VDPEVLARMGDRMASRGPDGQRTWASGRIGFVHRRLSVIDLHSRSDCPMLDVTTGCSMIFNGEIYNYLALRHEMEKEGRNFVTKGDGEVLLQGYLHWGESVLEMLDGMYAVALWDARKEMLLLARDRFGEKPLFYGQVGGKYVFASNVMAVVEGMGEIPEIDVGAMGEYLARSYIRGHHSIIRGVRMLEPATLVRLPYHDAKQASQTYWRLPSFQSRKLSPSTAIREVDRLLHKAVRSRFVADVPVGIALSGGVDSSIVTAIASDVRSSVKTFSVGFDEPGYDERTFARSVADHLKTDHVEVVSSEHDLLKNLPRLVWEYGQPFGDDSAVPLFALSRRARLEVKVLLTGDGGDELFGGYWRARAGMIADIYRRMVGVAALSHWMPRAASAAAMLGFRDFAGRWRRLNSLALEGGARYENTSSWHALMQDLRGCALIENAPSFDTPRDPAFDVGRTTHSILEGLMLEDVRVQLPDGLLTKVDVATMASGVEARAPFLDPDLAQYAWAMRGSLKIHPLHGTKWLLKKIGAKYVPRHVIYRQKQGFAVPLKPWFRGELGRVTADLLSEAHCFEGGWLRQEPVLRALDEHRKGANDHSQRLWLVLWLELWLRICWHRDMSPAAVLQK
jgi:asparagine synthase (glutamine-hydrolysing)